MKTTEKTDENKEEEVLMLHSLPLILPAVKPFAQELPMFLLRLATEVDYIQEESYSYE